MYIQTASWSGSEGEKISVSHSCHKYLLSQEARVPGGIVSLMCRLIVADSAVSPALTCLFSFYCQPSSGLPLAYQGCLASHLGDGLSHIPGISMRLFPYLHLNNMNTRALSHEIMYVKSLFHWLKLWTRFPSCSAFHLFMESATFMQENEILPLLCSIS